MKLFLSELTIQLPPALFGLIQPMLCLTPKKTTDNTRWPSPKSKGQVFSTDLVTATIIFTITLSLFFLSWEYGKTRLDETVFTRELENRAYMLSDTLVKTTGSPVDWEANPTSDNVTSVGLVRADRVVEPAKMEALGLVDPQRLMDVLRTGGNRALVTLRKTDGTVIKSVGTAPVGKYFMVSKRNVS